MHINSISNMGNKLNLPKAQNIERVTNIGFSGTGEIDGFSTGDVLVRQRNSRPIKYIRFVACPVETLPEVEFAKKLRNDFESSCDKDSSENTFIVIEKEI